MTNLYLLRKFSFVLGFAGLSISAAQAQQRIFRNYNSQTVQSAIASKDDSYENNLVLIENAVSNYSSRGDDNKVLLLPIIFHVLTLDGEKPVSDEQIKQQLAVLNKYFGSYDNENKEQPNEDAKIYDALGASPNIQFYQPDDNGNVKPVNYKATNRKNWGLVNQVQDPSQQGVAPFDPEHFINVYIAELDSNNAGYAHLPLTAPEFDGIVIDPDFFGKASKAGFTPYGEGKTLVHLMGIYLGLYELWNQKEPCQDDHVNDTPLHDNPTISVSTFPNTRNVCFCPGTPTTMYMNFMDNTDDAQLTLFTKGQVTRMRAVLLSESLRRNELVKK
jgi:hypothetical protein